jgi:glycosyltransferase involved in cell wall biosynthesis
MKLSPVAFDGVSVIIPSYNRAQYIGQAVASALNQGPVVGEVIVVDDGSTDDTLSVLSGIKDPRLRVFTQPQSGPAAARNAGLIQARGRWIQFLDSDDALP